jgi:hypothetical protein
MTLLLSVSHVPRYRHALISQIRQAEYLLNFSNLFHVTLGSTPEPNVSNRVSPFPVPLIRGAWDDAHKSDLC